MDLKECIRILAERQVSNINDPSCPCCKLPEFCPPVDNGAADNRGDVLHDSELAEVTALSLIDALLHVQESRVKTYNEYNRGLDDLLATAKLDSYPVLCSSMTEAFNKLSESAIRIKDEFKNRKMISLVQSIESIQKAEKDKLLYVAAFHLDRLQSQLPSLQSVSGNCEVQRTYLREKIQECESSISEQLQEIQSIKIELMEE